MLQTLVECFIARSHIEPLKLIFRNMRAIHKENSSLLNERGNRSAIAQRFNAYSTEATSMRKIQLQERKKRANREQAVV